LVERRSCSPKWSSTAGSALRRVEPASAIVAAPAPLLRTRSSGLAPMNAPSGEPQQKQKQDGKASRMTPKRDAGSWAEGAVAVRVRYVTPPERASATSGMTASAGGNEDQWGEPPPSGAKAKPPVHTGPAPAGRSSGASASRPTEASPHSRTTSTKRASPRET